MSYMLRMLDKSVNLKDKESGVSGFRGEKSPLATLNTSLSILFEVLIEPTI